MINRGYAAGSSQNTREAPENNQFSSVPNTSNQNMNAVQSAVATLLGERPSEARDTNREMLMNLVRQEGIEQEEGSFESDN